MLTQAQLFRLIAMKTALFKFLGGSCSVCPGWHGIKNPGLLKRLHWSWAPPPDQRRETPVKFQFITPFLTVTAIVTLLVSLPNSPCIFPQTGNKIKLHPEGVAVGSVTHWLLTTLAAFTFKFFLFILTQITAQLRIKKKKQTSIFRKKTHHGNVLQYIAQV